MTKKYSTKRSLIASILILCLCFTSFVGTTFAWFTDEVTSSGNKIVSGSLKIDLELLDKESGKWSSLKESEDAIFDYDNWEPGYIDAKVLKVDNEGTLALKWKAKFVSNETLGILADVIDVYVLPYGVLSDADAATKVAYPDRNLENYTKVGTVRDFVNTIETTTYGELLKGESAYLGIALKMQESAGNIYQEETLGAFDIQIVATQLASEEDSFGKDYDAGAEYDGEITNSDGFAAAVAAGGTYKVMNDFALDKAAEVGTEDTIIDLNGKTITAGADGYVIDNSKGGKLTIGDSASGTVVYARRALAKSGELKGIVYTGEGSTTIVNSGTFSAADGGAYVFNNSKGTLIFNGGTVNGGSSYPINSFGAGHHLIINDVTVNGTFGCVNAYSTGGKVEINGGTYTMTGVEATTSHIVYLSNVDAVINGGYFAHVGDISMSAASGGGICVIYGADVTINGGTFEGDYADIYNWGGTNKNEREVNISIKGGNFKFAPAANMIANTYELVENADGTWSVIFPQDSFDSLIDNAKPGEPINIPAGNFTFPASKLSEGMVLDCAEGTVFKGASSLNIGGATVNGATFSNPGGAAGTGTINGTFKNCTFEGANAMRWSYAGDTVVFENCEFIADSIYAIHFDQTTNGEILFKNCKIVGWVAIGSGHKSLTFDGCEIYGNGRYGVIRTYGDATIKNCTFDVADVNVNDVYQDGIHAVECTITVENCKNVNGEVADILNLSSATIILDGEYYVSNNTLLKSAINDKGATKVMLTNGEYDLNGIQKNGLSIVGLGDNVKVANTTKYASGKSIGAIWQKIHLENVTITNTVYTMADGGNSTFKNVHFAAGVREAYGKNVVFEGCSFGSNSEGYALHFQSDSASEGGNITIKDCEFLGGKVHLGGKRAYTFTGCEFAEGTDFQVWANVTLDGCTVNGVEVTADNANTLFPNLDLNKVTFN